MHKIKSWSFWQQDSSYKKLYFTAIATQPLQDQELLSFFTETFHRLCAENVVIVQEKIYGLPDRCEIILSHRKEALLHLQHDDLVESPHTFIGSIPCVGGTLAGIQIIALAKAKEVNPRLIRHRGMPLGWLWEDEDGAEVYLSGLSASGLTADEQFGAVFNIANQCLNTHRLHPRHIVRTWIYLPNLLTYYDSFNRARNACFNKFGLSCDHLPASTGIQGQRYGGEEIFMDIYALSATGKKVTPLQNRRQNQAWQYGSFFSRGMSVSNDHSLTCYISGTASIDASGVTNHVSDEQGQITDTLLSIESLISEHRLSTRDLVMSTVFCKTAAVYEQFRVSMRDSKIADLPLLPVYADICRDNLLFEMDGIAIRQ